MEIKIKGNSVSVGTPTNQRISGFLWGAPKCGKTTLACTAPGGKLLINFDPDGYASINNRTDVVVADLSVEGSDIIDKLKTDNPLIKINGETVSLANVLNDNPCIQTVIYDSITALLQFTLKQSIKIPAVMAMAGRFGAALEVPTMAGWTARNALAQQVMSAALKVTGVYHRNCLFIAHEIVEKNDDGIAVGTTPNISEGLLGQMTGAFSEIWNIIDTGKERRIVFRSSKGRHPAGTRMFQMTTSEFIWKYDAETAKGEGIADWYARWKAAEYKKIPPPQ